MTHRVELREGWVAWMAYPGDGAAPSAGAPPSRVSVEALYALLLRLTADASGLPADQLLKYSTHGEVHKAPLMTAHGPREVIAKQSRPPRSWRRMFAPVLSSRERRNFNRALRLLSAGIDTAPPVALLERRRPRLEAWLITEYVPDLMDLDQIVLRFLPRLEYSTQRHIRSAIIDAIVNLLHHMERCGLTHRDLKASNILLQDFDGPGLIPKVWLVDLDGLVRRIAPKRYSRGSQIVRLAASLQGYSSVTRSDRCRFLRTYLARTAGAGVDWKAYSRRLEPKVQRYVRESARRKAHKLDGYGG